MNVCSPLQFRGHINRQISLVDSLQILAPSPPMTCKPYLGEPVLRQGVHEHRFVSTPQTLELFSNRGESKGPVLISKGYYIVP